MVGGRHAYNGYPCTYNPGEVVGRGIFLSPDFNIARLYTKEFNFTEGTKNRLIFMCRVNPQGLWIPQDNKVIWVAKHASDVRPYGILLMKNE